MIHQYQDKQPVIHETAFIAKDATIIGDVEIDQSSSIWFKTIIRGDVAPTRIGERVNIQDLSMLHQSPGMPLVIEDDSSVFCNKCCFMNYGLLILILMNHLNPPP